LIEVEVFVVPGGDEAGEGVPAGGGDVLVFGIDPFEGEGKGVIRAGGDPGDGIAEDGRGVGFGEPALEVLFGHFLVVGDEAG